jgi:septal ring factor EnvC (AmiA/AmiB activator)
MDITELKGKLSFKTIAMAVGFFILGVVLLFAVLKWQSGWASNLLFSEIKTQIEAQVKERDAIIANLNTELGAINEQKAKLQTKLDKNTKELATMKKKREDVTTAVTKLKKNEIAEAFTKMGY